MISILKKRSFILILVAVLGLIAIFFYVRIKETSGVDTLYIEEPEASLDFQFYGEGDRYLLIKEDNEENTETKRVSSIRVSQHYVMTESYQVRDGQHLWEDWEPITSNEEESYEVQLYDIDNGFQKQRIDIIALFKRHQLVGSVWGLDVIYYEGSDYLYFKTLVQSEDEEEIYQHYLYQIDSQELSQAPEELIDVNSLITAPYYLNSIYNTEMSSIVKNQFNLFIGGNYRTFSLKASGGETPTVSGTNLEKEEPVLVKALSDGYVLYTRSEQVDAEEWFNTLIHWFAPAGEEVMELYAKDYDTQEKTVVKSYDDFMAWLETHPEMQ